MSIGPWQILIIVAIVLIFFGPKRLPGLGTSIGEAIRGFKKGLTDDEIDVTDASEKARLHEGEEDPTRAHTKAETKEKQPRS